MPLTALIPVWWKLAAAGVVAVALAGGAWKLRHNGVVAGRADVQLKWDTEKTALVQLAQRTRDNQLEANLKVDNDYQKTKARIAADRRTTDDRLREYQTAAANSAAATTASGADEPYRAISDQCTAAIAVLDSDFKKLAGKAAALQDYTRAMLVTQ